MRALSGPHFLCKNAFAKMETCKNEQVAKFPKMRSVL